MSSLSGPVALVTGASSGIGAAFAKRLAASGYDLVLVARREQRLVAAARELTSQYGVNVEVVVADLTDDDGIAKVVAHIEREPSLALLVNNAGFSGYGPFAEMSHEVLTGLIMIHVDATARLSRAAVPGMIARKSGAIINVSSLLSFSGTIPAGPPLPQRAMYSAAKAFMLTFSQALANELRDSGVVVQALTPGVVSTEFHGGRSTGPLIPMSADDVVHAALADLGAGEAVCVPGLADSTLLEQIGIAQRAVLISANKPELASRYVSSQ
jgi:short-subunit dehydrogenase